MPLSPDLLGLTTLKRSTAGDLTIRVEAWDSGRKSLNVGSSGSPAQVVSVTVSDDLVHSLAYLLYEAGFQAASSPVRGINPSASGYKIRVMSGGFHWSTNGTIDGSNGSGNGVDADSASPTPSTLSEAVSAGQYLIIGVE